jgi:integrase
MNTAEPTPTCPQCGSNKLYKDGLRYLADGTTVQRWLCRDCGYRFTNPNHKRRSKWKNPPFNLNLQNCLNDKCQGNNDPEWRDPTSLGRLVQTLATVENPPKSGLAGATENFSQENPAQSNDMNAKILEFAWKLKKQGYAESTIKGRVKLLKRLVRLGANLLDPESVKEAIAKMTCSDGRKELAAEAYSSFLLTFGGRWDPPKYRRIEKLPFIPTETEIEQIIAGCSHTKRLMTFLQLLKETGMRCGEACRLQWTDIDFENNTIRVMPEKGSNPRMLKISNKLVAMLQALPKTSTKVFGVSVDAMRKSFARQRARLARKLENPRLLQITFHTLRHWKATMEYAKTKDILHVMQLLGHKNIQNTLIYTHLVNFKEDEYVAKVAHTEEEICQLVEAGFEYVCDYNGNKIFRKRK